jgi:uncharacterized protein
MYNFFLENGIHDVAFNIDEIEGHNTKSTILQSSSDQELYEFFYRLLELNQANNGTLRIREFVDFASALSAPPNSHFIDGTNQPLDVITVSYEGHVSTFSPELIGSYSEPYNNFIFGNINSNDFFDILKDRFFLQANIAIREGTEDCRRHCSYWEFCGGGSPSNRFFETGRLNASQTKACRALKQIPTKACLDFFRRKAAENKQN